MQTLLGPITLDKLPPGVRLPPAALSGSAMVATRPLRAATLMTHWLEIRTLQLVSQPFTALQRLTLSLPAVAAFRSNSHAMNYLVSPLTLVVLTVKCHQTLSRPSSLASLRGMLMLNGLGLVSRWLSCLGECRPP